MLRSSVSYVKGSNYPMRRSLMGSIFRSASGIRRRLDSINHRSTVADNVRPLVSRGCRGCGDYFASRPRDYRAKGCRRRL